MKSLFKGKLGTVVILVITFILAGVAIFTAIRLYQLRSQPVAPTAPTSQPKAAVETTTTSCALSFTLSTATATATSTATATGTSTSTSTATATATSTATATGTSTGTPTSTPTKTSSAAPTATPPELPQSGTSWPTIMGIGVGILVILGSLLLAL